MQSILFQGSLSTSFLHRWFAALQALIFVFRSSSPLTCCAQAVNTNLLLAQYRAHAFSRLLSVSLRSLVFLRLGLGLRLVTGLPPRSSSFFHYNQVLGSSDACIIVLGINRILFINFIVHERLLSEDPSQ